MMIRNTSTRLVLASILLASSASAVRPGDLSTKFPIDDDQPLASVPSMEARDADPLEFGYWLQDVISRAELPFQQRQWAEAVKYYEVLVKAVPESTINYRKLCVAQENLGDLAKAEANCWEVLQHEGSKVIDYHAYLGLAIAMVPLTTDGEAKLQRVARIEETLEHLRAAVPKVQEDVARGRAANLAEGQPSDAVAAEAPIEQQVELQGCKLAAALADAAKLDACVRRLSETGAARPVVVPFEWAALRLTGASRQRMDEFIAEAKRAGLPAAALDALQAPVGTDQDRTKPTAVYGAPLAQVAQLPTTQPSSPLDAVAGSDGPGRNAATVAPAPSPLEAWVAGLAALVGLGAIGWWLRERALGKSVVAGPSV